MTPFELKKSLESMTLLVDSREQPTENLKRRIEQTGLPHERRKLDFGDYSCQCALPNGSILDFSNRAVIERKMNLDELCLCFGKERGRFEKEFERAKAAVKPILDALQNWGEEYKASMKHEPSDAV